MAMAMQIDDLGETGKMATLKQDPETGIFDVDFGGSEPEEKDQQRIESGNGKSTIDRLVEERQQQKPAETKPTEEKKPPAGTIEECSTSDFNQIDILAKT